MQGVLRFNGIVRRAVHLALLLSVSACITGCLSVARIAKLDVFNGIHKWDEARQEYVWHECDRMCDPLSMFGLYPTMQMRWQMLRLAWNWSPPRYRLQRRVCIPCVELLLLPGAIVDIAVDTVSIPWDWEYRSNSRDLVMEELPEREARSLCKFCGATSDGDFSVCYRCSDRNTARAVDMYGVCSKCTGTVNTNGYYFTTY